MPIYVLGTLFPQYARCKNMLGDPSISTLTVFLATFSLLIIQIFNSNLRARIMAVGKTSKSYVMVYLMSQKAFGEVSCSHVRPRLQPRAG